MRLPQGWDQLDPDVHGDVLVVAFDLGQNVVLDLRSYGRPLIPNLPDDAKAMGPSFILEMIHPDDHEILLDSLERSARMTAGQSTLSRMRILVDGDYQAMCIRTTPLLLDRFGHVYAVRSVVYREPAQNEA